ncbi:hypothetical protein NDN08_005749 [Rhodosorus marinus]|uniref:Uncharacterized protein n=1 Tax=Rhodosorus marinus TaxID=101924 RepID=A0AAV8V4X0_9RHOD|nr:hypothetical protein NDN08_005749 [Rhodosorus marinus]
MKAVVVWYFAVLFICAVSVDANDARTCADASVTTGQLLESIEGVSKDLVFNGETVGTVTVRVQPNKEPLCVRMEFDVVDSFSLVSIRGGIFTKKELIPEPVKYRNRRNAAKVVASRGQPEGTLLNRLSLVICQDEMVADEMGCCENSSLFWIGHAIVKGLDGEEFRVETTPDGTCELRVAYGLDVPVCELPVVCSCNAFGLNNSCMALTGDDGTCRCCGDVGDECAVGDGPDAMCLELDDFEASLCPEVAIIKSPGSCACIIRGTSDSELILGTEQDDIIFGYAGNDEIFGLGGDDYIYGDEGYDIISGGDGNDRIFGGSGDDVIFGFAGDDRLYGQRGNDRLYGGDDNDILSGDDGVDSLDGGSGDDLLYD